jgi:hypothetical protein
VVTSTSQKKFWAYHKNRSYVMGWKRKTWKAYPTYLLLSAEHMKFFESGKRVSNDW